RMSRSDVVYWALASLRATARLRVLPEIWKAHKIPRSHRSYHMKEHIDVYIQIKSGGKNVVLYYPRSPPPLNANKRNYMHTKLSSATEAPALSNFVSIAIISARAAWSRSRAEAFAVWSA